MEQGKRAAIFVVAFAYVNETVFWLVTGVVEARIGFLPLGILLSLTLYLHGCKTIFPCRFG